MIKYQLSIITTKGQVFDGQIESLIATGISGSFGVMGMHAPMIVALANGPLTIKKDGVESYFQMSSGVLEVNHQSNCLILADTAVPSRSLEEVKSSVVKES